MKLIRQAQAQINHVISFIETEEGEKLTINDYYHPSGESIMDSIIHDHEGNIITSREIGDKAIADIYDLLDEEEDKNVPDENQIPETPTSKAVEVPNEEITDIPEGSTMSDTDDKE